MFIYYILNPVCKFNNVRTVKLNTLIWKHCVHHIHISVSIAFNKREFSKIFVYLVHHINVPPIIWKILVVGHWKFVKNDTHKFTENIYIKTFEERTKMHPQENIILFFSKFLCWYDWQCFKIVLYLVYTALCKIYVQHLIFINSIQ